MADMLVKLYDLPDSAPLYEKLKAEGIEIIRPMSPNRDRVLAWIREYFGDGWASEVTIAFGSHPINCFIAVDKKERKILGFAGYDCTVKNFFGPTGVQKEYRGRGIGKALLFKCLEAMRDDSYGYAIIGDAGPVDFYAKACGATVIEGCQPGVYKDMI